MSAWATFLEREDVGQAFRDLAAVFAEFFEALRGMTARERKVRTLGTIQRRLERALMTAFRRQGTALLRRLPALRPLVDVPPTLQEAIRSDDWEPLFDAAAAETVRAFELPLSELTRKALELGAAAAIGDLGLDISFDLENPRAVAYLNEKGAERVAGITDTTREELRRILTRAAEEGWSHDRTAREIRAKYAQFSTPQPQQHIRSRAHLIAVQELADAYEAGNRLVVDDMAAGGLTMQKSWLGVKDSREEGLCLANTGAGWIDLAAPFPGGAQRAPQHVACRCTVLYRRKPEGSKA